MVRGLLLALLLAVPGAGTAQQGPAPMGGRESFQPETFMRTGDAVTLCLRREPQWIDFCNGLVQAYAENAILKGVACIPFGTSRRELVEVFTGADVVVSTGFIDNLPALETAVEMFVRHYPCS